MQRRLDDIADEILNGQERSFNPAIKPLQEMVRRYSLMRRARIKFRIDERCTRCGICAQVCPVQNIELKHTGTGTVPTRTAPIRSDKCEACYACLHWCPAGAISTSHRPQNRYHNPQVNPQQLMHIPPELKSPTTPTMPHSDATNNKAS
jgi:ferredoxin